MSKRVEDLDPAEAAVNFEAVITFAKKDAKGFHMNLVVDPALVPESLFRAWIGSRYVVAMVKLADDDSIEIPPEIIAGNKAVASAALICKEEDFQEWVCSKGWVDALSEEEAADAIRFTCQVISRGEFRTSSNARKRFERMRDDYYDWRRDR